MFAQFSKSSLFHRVIVVAIIASFVMSGAPVSGLASNNMRIKSANDDQRLETIINDVNPNNFDGGNLQVQTTADLTKNVNQDNIDSGFIGVDWNIKDLKKADDLERVIKSLDTFETAYRDLNSQYYYIFTHRGRPKGKGYEADSSLAPIVEKARELMAERKIDAVIELLPYDLDQAQKRIEELKQIHKGKKIFFVFDNVRFYPEEKSKDKDVRRKFEERLIALTGRNADKLFYINEAFDKSHRGKESSMELVNLIDVKYRAAGLALERDLSDIISFIENLTGELSLMFGGAKFDKVEDISTVTGVKQSIIKDLFIVGAQANMWLSLMQNKPIGKSLMPKAEDLEDIKPSLEAIKNSGVNVVAPADFLVVKEKKVKKDDGTETTVKEYLADQSEIADDASQVDIGSKTIQDIKNRIASLKAGDGFIMNGGAGVFDKDKASQRGTFELIEEAEKAADRGVAILFAGGDMDKARRLYEEYKGRPINPKIKRTTGGGVVWAILAQGPENLPAIKAVLKPTAASADGGNTIASGRVFIGDISWNFLRSGAFTSRVNLNHVIKERSDGFVLDHSEIRGFVETIFGPEFKRLIFERYRAMDSYFTPDQKSTIKEYLNVFKNKIAPSFKDFVMKTTGLPEEIPGETAEAQKVRLAEFDALVMGILDEMIASTSGNEKDVIDAQIATIANLFVNTQLHQLDRAIQRGEYVPQITTLALGETKEQYDKGMTYQVLERDLKQMLAGLSQAQINRMKLRVAYEARWVIGKGDIPHEVLGQINDIQGFIKKVAKEQLGLMVEVDYGASVNADNINVIAALPNVDGVLVGGAAKDPATIGPVIDGLIVQGEKKGKILHAGLNWKAETKDSKLKSSADFVEMLKNKDLNKVQVTIYTPKVAVIKKEVQKPHDNWKLDVVRAAGKVKAKLQDLRKIILMEGQVDKVVGADEFDSMVNTLASVSEIKGKIIQDSRKRDTLRVTIATNMGVTGLGEAPAGESTGEGEAATVKPAYAVETVIPKINELLLKANLDLKNYNDVIRAHQLILQAFENDYSKLGGNTFTALSWALMDLHAKLNGQAMYENFRANNPWWNTQEGPMYFITNNLNHGRHAPKAAGTMGIDLLDAQEIMFVALTPKAKMLKDKLEQRLKTSDQAFLSLGSVLDKAIQRGEVVRKMVGDEAGWTVTGLTDMYKAVDYMIAAGEEMGLEAGKDYMISFDIAASSFYNKDTGLYRFMGKDRTSQEMIDFYVEFVKSYQAKLGRNIFYTFEDPLDENDWNNWPVLTAALEALGVETVGDDLFCTQIELLKKGISMKAASMILIKVNQVGNVPEAIEVMRIARENGMGFIISHRSGETLFPGIAHLFYAFGADALKSGATQPSELFANEEDLVRRSKYQGSVDISQGKVSYKKDNAVILDADYISKAGMRPISKLDRLSNIQVIVAGTNAAKVKTLLGIYGVDQKNIATAKSLADALSKAGQMGISTDKTVAIVTPDKKTEIFKQSGVKAISANGAVPYFELGMAVYAMYNNDATKAALATFDQKVAQKMISPETKKSLDEMLVQLNQGTLSLSDIKLTEEVSKKVAQSKQQISDFLGI